MDDLIRRLLQLPPRASTAAPGLDHLHFVVIGLAVLVAFATFAVLAFFFARYRDRPDTARATPPKPSSKPEIVLGSITLAIFMALWVVGFAQLRAMRTPPRDALQIYVVGKQWMWSFVYPDGTSAQDELRVPIGEPVELLLTSRDVIHSFYVPAFRNKEDAVPGRMTVFDFTATAPGRYQIECAEYCGAGHSRMRGTVIAMPRAEYDAWLAAHPAPALASAGAQVASDHGCLRCHDAPAIAPPLAGAYGTIVPLADGSSATVDAGYITESIMDPAAKVHAGYQAIMPSYLGQLSAADTAAIVEYMRGAKP